MSGLTIFGERTTGQDVRTQNITAALGFKLAFFLISLAVANVVKTSLGPVGLDKMLVDELGDVTITNDGATILQLLEVQHPAAKVLVELSQLQDTEIGDGTTSVVLLAAELLKRANELVKTGIHPTTLISGFQLAKVQAAKFISQFSIKIDAVDRKILIDCARTSISSKIISSDAKYFANMIVDAVLSVKSNDVKPRYPIAAINILKSHGKSLRESELLGGYALHSSLACQQMLKKIVNARIALLDIDLRKSKMAMGVQILIKDVKEVEGIMKKEAQITKDRIMLLINAGANVILTTKGIDDQAMKYFIENNAIAIRRVDMKDIKHIAKATGGTLLGSLGDFEGNESIEPSNFGVCEEVSEEKIGDGDVIYFKGCKVTKAQTIIVRGANDYMVEEISRSLHDGLSAVRRTLESASVIPGAGACETATSVYLERFAETMGSREQLAVSEFAQALLVIPKTLAVNGALDATELVAKLYAGHASAQARTLSSLDLNECKTSEYKWYGLDLINGTICDSINILEPAISKIKCIKFATEAAIAILRIDDSIKMKKKIDPKGPHGR